MSLLAINDLCAGIPGRQILHGVNLRVGSGEVHAVMGPNGSGKSTLSHVLAGRGGYVNISGSVTLDDAELLGMLPHQRVRAGLFLAMQYPIEVPGVSITEMMRKSFEGVGRDTSRVEHLLSAEAERVGLATTLLDRPLNVDMSGGEKKRNETVQLGVLQPKFAVLDELDSGLDIDALRSVARRVEAATSEFGLGVLCITHYSRMLTELRPDKIHVMVRGEIVASGGPELADQLEAEGYAAFGIEDGELDI